MITLDQVNSQRGRNNTHSHIHSTSVDVTDSTTLTPMNSCLKSSCDPIHHSAPLSHSYAGDTKDTGKNHTWTESIEQHVLQSWGPAWCNPVEMCVLHVTQLCVSNSHFHSWAMVGESSCWTDWSWPPYTLPLALLRLRPQPGSVGVEYCSGLGWDYPGPGEGHGCLEGG